nr:class I SAM-dependent methyltransferase [Verrucomicrobiota bacterium]
EMLLRAREKGLTNTVIADALNLPLPNESFDCVTVAFGLRNMADWSAALREMGRVLRAEGHLLVLEFSIPTGLLKPAYRFYLHRCMPVLAALITRQKDAYEYLGASIENFPRGNAMLTLMEANGFRGARAIPLTGGIASIYAARVA